MTGNSHPTRRLEDYLDSALTPQEREEFERRIAADAELASEVKRQRAIDESLRRQFRREGKWAFRGAITPADSNGQDFNNRQSERLCLTDAERADDRHGRTSTARFSSRRWLAIAASLILVLVGGYLIYGTISPRIGDRGPSIYLPGVQRTLYEHYQVALSLDFEPDWICETDEEFAEHFEKRFGRAVLVRSDHPEVEALGVSYAHAVSPRTLSVLFHTPDGPVMVFVDRLEADPPGGLLDDANQRGDMNLFRKEVGQGSDALVIYELTSGPSPWALDVFIPAAER